MIARGQVLLYRAQRKKDLASLQELHAEDDEEDDGIMGGLGGLVDDGAEGVANIVKQVPSSEPGRTCPLMSTMQHAPFAPFVPGSCLKINKANFSPAQVPMIGIWVTIMMPPNFEAEFFWEITGELQALPHLLFLFFAFRKKF